MSNSEKIRSAFIDAIANKVKVNAKNKLAVVNNTIDNLYDNIENDYGEIANYKDTLKLLPIVFGSYIDIYMKIVDKFYENNIMVNSTDFCCARNFSGYPYMSCDLYYNNKVYPAFQITSANENLSNYRLSFRVSVCCNTNIEVSPTDGLNEIDTKLENYSELVIDKVADNVVKYVLKVIKEKEEAGAGKPYWYNYYPSEDDIENSSSKLVVGASLCTSYDTNSFDREKAKAALLIFNITSRYNNLVITQVRHSDGDFVTSLPENTDTLYGLYHAYGEGLDEKALMSEGAVFEGYHIINRFRGYNYSEFIEHYGENLIFKFSKHLYYVNGHGWFILNCRDSGYRNFTLTDNPNTLSKSALSFLSNEENYKYLMHGLPEERATKALSYLNSINEYDDSNDYNGGRCILTASEISDEIKKQRDERLAAVYTDIINGNILKPDEYREEITSVNVAALLTDAEANIQSKIDSLESDIRDYKQRIDENILTKMHLENILLTEVVDRSEMEAQFDKAERIIKRYMKLNVVDSYSYELINRKYCLKIQTKWLPMIYYDAKLLNNYASYATDSTNNPNVKELRRNLVKKMYNLEDDAPKFISNPLTIYIYYKEGSMSLQHSFAYDMDSEVNNLYRNSHQKYGISTGIGIEGGTGCLGTFRDVFSKASNDMDVPALVAASLQWSQTYSPGDGAGNNILRNCPIVDNNNIVLSSIHEKDIVGKKCAFDSVKGAYFETVESNEVKEETEVVNN